MKSVTSCFVSSVFTMLLLCIAPHGAWAAIPAITCHCFTDRSYDPSRPTLADPYFLATTQNSFFAIVFKIDKKAIVMKKQQGVSGDDLWVAYWLGMKASLAPEDLLKNKTDTETWRKVSAAHRIATKGLGAAFNEALQADAPASRLSQLAVDDLFRSYRLLSDPELAGIRKAGASNQELIIATLIAAKTGRSARQVYQDVKSGGKAWGVLLQQAKIDTRNMQRELVVTLKVPST